MGQADLIKSQNNEFKCFGELVDEYESSINERLSEMNSKDKITEQDSSFPEEIIEQSNISPFNLAPQSSRNKLEETSKFQKSRYEEESKYSDDSQY